jgi:hypothetical protein
MSYTPPNLATSLILALGLALFSVSTALCSDPLRREPLFKIERSKNANIIQYDAQIGPDGKLDSKKPVVAYWVRLAEQGQLKELSWIQRKFAFGFDADYDPVTDSASMDMEVDIGRSITVIRDGDVYRAGTTIGGLESFLDRIYIQAHKHGLIINVEYVDVFGKDANTGEERFEHFVP